MKLLKKAFAAGLALTLAVSATACGSNTTWAATAGELTIPAGVYIAQVMNAYYDVTAQLPPETKNPLKEQVDGVSAADKITANAKTELNKYIAVEQKFTEMGLTLSAEDELYITQMAESYWQYLGETYLANGISKESYLKMTANDQKRQVIFNAIYGEGGTEPVPEQELKDSFYNDFAKLILVPLNLSQSEDATQKDTDNQKARDMIDRFLKEAQGGKDMEDIVYEAKKEITGDDTLVKPAAGESFSFLSRENTGYDQKLIDAVFSAENGVATVVETDTNLYLFQRYDIQENANDFVSRKTSLVATLRTDAFNQKLDEWAAAVSGVTYNDALFKRFAPGKLKL